MGFADQVETAIRAVAKVDLKNFKMKDAKQSLVERVMNFFVTKVKNEYTETLADGTVIIVLSDTEDWTGKQVILEDGSPLPPGDYPMADGKTLTIGDGGMITTVTDPEPTDNTEQPTENDMKQIEQLKAQLAEAEAKIAAAEAGKTEAQTEAATAKAAALKFENRMAAIEEQLKEASKTVGDKTPPKLGTGQKMVNRNQPVDHMGEFALDFYKKRGIIKQED
jgi:DNA repair exonuclease SbcCD ATPase subunit